MTFGYANTPKPWFIEELKIRLSKLESSAFQNTLRKMKTSQAMDGEKIFAKHVSSTGFVFRTYKRLSKLSKKTE